MPSDVCTCDVGMCTRRHNCRFHGLDRAAPTNAADATRSKQARIARLRRRLDQLPPGASPEIIAFLKGLLDLLEDEL